MHLLTLFNANIDNTIVVIIGIFCFTIIVISKFQYRPSLYTYTLLNSYTHASNKTKHFSYTGGYSMSGIIGVLRHLKEELTWAIDKWFQVISNKSNVI